MTISSILWGEERHLPEWPTPNTPSETDHNPLASERYGLQQIGNENQYEHKERLLHCVCLWKALQRVWTKRNKTMLEITDIGVKRFSVTTIANTDNPDLDMRNHSAQSILEPSTLQLCKYERALPNEHYATTSLLRQTFYIRLFTYSSGKNRCSRMCLRSWLCIGHFFISSMAYQQQQMSVWKHHRIQL